MNDDHYDFGAELFDREPELPLTEVWLRACLYARAFAEQHEFVTGYRNARARHEQTNNWRDCAKPDDR